MPKEIVVDFNQTSESLYAETQQIQEAILRLNAIRPFTEINLAKTEEQIHRLGENLAKINELQERFEALKENASTITKAKENLDYYEKLAEDIIRFARALIQQRRYDDAKEATKLFDNHFMELDFGFPLHMQKAIREIQGHLVADACAEKGENHIVCNTPFEEGEIEEYEERAKNLGTGIDGEKSRYFHMDKILGFKYIQAYWKWSDSIQNSDDILSVININGELGKEGMELSELTQQRRQLFVDLIQARYNELSQEAFEDSDYEKALFYYEHREFIDVEALTCEAYRLPSEEEFHIAYLNAASVRMSEENYFQFCKDEEKTLADEDPFSLRFVALSLASEELSEAKFELLAASVNNCGFETMLVAFGAALDHGLSEERQFSLLSALVHTKKKVANLDRIAPALRVLDEKLAPSQRKAYNGLRHDLLRSPHAKKVAVKSTEEATHALFGETKETFRAPIGKKVKNPRIKSWDFMTKAFYVAFAIIFPILLAVAGAIFISFAQIDDQLRYPLYAAPVAFALVFVMLAIRARFGTDERGSGVWGWVLLWNAFIFGLVAVCIFAFNPWIKTYVPMPYGYSVLGVSALLGICSVFIHVLKKKQYFVLQGFVILLLIASAMLIVYRLMNPVA